MANWFQDAAQNGPGWRTPQDFRETGLAKSGSESRVNKCVRLLPLKIPMMMDLPFGHVPHNATLPVGAHATLDATNGRLILGEPPSPEKLPRQPTRARYLQAMIATTETFPKVWTEEELQSLPDDGFNHQVVNGELVMSPKNNFIHGRICTRLLAAMEIFNQKHRLGVVLDSSTGFWMFNRNCRAPDVSFITKARVENLNFDLSARQFFPGAPDLAVEILSPNNSRSEIDQRLRDFFASGTQIAWLVNPDTESVEVCRSLTQRRLIGPGGEFDGEHLLPGFLYPINNLFKGWGWE